jgi:cobalt-zinc-cadmium efflux system protein
MTKEIKNNTFSDPLFSFRNIEKKKLLLSLIITLVVMFIELIGGFLANSIALLSDAGHMFTHSFAILISLIAIIIAKKPPCHHRTFGLYRAEILAAFINGLFLLIVVIIIIYEAVQRIIQPREVFGLEMLMIAFIGLSANLASIIILHGSHKHNLNIKGVFFHMIADAFSSIGIVIAALIILFTEWNLIDPIVSLLISALILYWAWGILKESSRILLEIAPKGLNIDIINDDLKQNFSQIKEIYNAHLWTITPEMIVFSAHILLKPDKLNIAKEKTVKELNDFLTKKYKVIESTIQLTDELDKNIC